MKSLLIIASAAILLTSCNRGELERTSHQRDSLLTVAQERDASMKEQETSLNDFITSFNEVERNLDSVAARQHIIAEAADKGKGDLRATQRERINSQINAINDLTEENRRTVNELKGKLKGSSKLNAKLKETINTLQSQLAQKDLELASLNEKLNALHAQVAQLQTALDTLTAQNNMRAKIIEENTAAMHTAYYIVGRAKDLREANLIDRKGGLLGIGKTSQLNSNFDNTKFTKIDLTQTTQININSSNVKIITTHPTDSYKMETDPEKKGTVKILLITNPQKFWSASKYLVVEGSPVKS